MRNAFADDYANCQIGSISRFVIWGHWKQAFDKFKKSKLDRFVNCGVAEANMVTMSSGLVMSGRSRSPTRLHPSSFTEHLSKLESTFLTTIQPSYWLEWRRPLLCIKRLNPSHA